jgi:hypothetical protein
VALFKNAKAFSSFSVDNLGKAKQFYGQTPDLKVSDSNESLTLSISDGNEIFIYPKAYHTPAISPYFNFSC